VKWGKKNEVEVRGGGEVERGVEGQERHKRKEGEKKRERERTGVGVRNSKKKVT